MPRDLPSIIVTGASGFIGRHFLEAIKGDYLVYGLARRSQTEAGVAPHPNIRWIQVDLGNWEAVKRVMQTIKREGGVEFILHLAAFYDFSNAESPEYLRTNVNGTRHMLEQAKWLGVKRFIFVSSLTVSEFPPPGGALTEQSPPDAGFPYARSKRRGEEMVREYSSWFPCSIIRLTAVWSDWCEYAPLYVFLSTWLSHRWNARILGGKGESAVCYIHIDDVTELFLCILRQSAELPSLDVYIGSGNGSTSHRELFESASRYYFGRAPRPLLIPRHLATLGVVGRDLWGRLRRQRPFERLWMMKYVDRKLNVDSSYTQRVLSWQPTPRLHVLRRMVFMIEKLKSRPHEWTRRNEVALKREVVRPNLLIYETLHARKHVIRDSFIREVTAPARRIEFRHYQEMDRKAMLWAFDVIFQLLAVAVRTEDRMLMLDYMRGLAKHRMEEGFECSEICSALMALGNAAVRDLQSRVELGDTRQAIHDYVMIPIEMAMDEVEDLYAGSAQGSRRRSGRGPGEAAADRGKDLDRLLKELESYQRPSADEEDAPYFGDQ